MTDRQKLGIAVLAAPFITMYVAGAFAIGILPITGIFLGSGLFIASVYFGFNLLEDKPK